jgi:ketosteroid isomerase-like protein
MNTRELVQAYFDMINSGDWDNWVALFADNIVIDEALSGHMEGMEAVRQSAAGIQQGFQRFTNSIDELVVEGDKAMVVCTIDATTGMGTHLRSTGANFYRVADGKIVYMSSFHDKEPFIKAFTPPA